MRTSQKGIDLVKRFEGFSPVSFTFNLGAGNLNSQLEENNGRAYTNVKET